MTPVQQAVERLLEVLEPLPGGEQIDPGILRPELQQIAGKLFLEGCDAGQRLALTRLRELYDRVPRVADRVLRGDDPEDVAANLKLELVRHRGGERRAAS